MTAIMRDQERRAFMAAWLAGPVGPAQIVADADGWTGPGLRWEVAPLLVGLTGAVLGVQDFFWTTSLGRAGTVAMSLLSVAGWAATLLLFSTRKNVYAAVNGIDLIVVEVRGRYRPVRLLTCQPVAALQFSTKSGLLADTVTCARVDGGALDIAAGQQAKIRLMIRGRRARREELVAAAGTCGATINLPLTPPLLPSYRRG